MAKSQSTRPPHGGKPSILSRDQDANEHLIGVADHPSGFVSVFDDEVIRILTPSATVALILALTHAVGTYVPVQPGPFSGSM